MGSRESLSRVLLPADASAALDATTKQALDLKAPLASPAFTGTPTGITKAHVGLGNVDNTSDANKPVSTAQQTALDAKQPLDADLTTIAGLTATTDSVMQAKAGAWTARTLAQLRTDLALQPLDADLTTIAALTPTNDDVLQYKAGAWANRTLAQLKTDLSVQPLDSDLTTIAGLTATTDSFMQAKAGAWASRTIAQVKTDLAISNVDNTSDANKPVSTAQATSIATKAPLSLFAIKSGDESVTSNVTLQNDDHLFVTLATNSTYLLDGYLIYSGAISPAGGLKLAWTGPSGFAMTWTGYGPNTGATIGGSYDVVAQTATTGRVYATLDTPLLAMRAIGVVTTGGTGGTFTLQWAQGTSNAVATVLKASSWIRLDKVA